MSVFAGSKFDEVARGLWCRVAKGFWRLATEDLVKPVKLKSM